MDFQGVAHRHGVAVHDITTIHLTYTHHILIYLTFTISSVILVAMAVLVLSRFFGPFQTPPEYFTEHVCPLEISGGQLAY